ncbi:putative iron ABC transporter, permease protein [Halobacteriovorax marinus SJ]|uniref:Iron ABC transporter, permease protein n=1 Tax=Halobacteriovorax marinus (strain ATCC BAA-682 / DSM 15412 / SJ) TaxID=862908 RepID=E1X3C4_HALMS|nr:iron ABC transporter permease [Halobacteriovorax marinus]CBW25219.1 putative iron ABC transporter, permease protein [Halobacteriovorax marinus SJ]
MKLKFLALFFLLVIVSLFSIMIGPGDFKFSDPGFSNIVWNIRLPQLLMSFLVGGLLSLSGLLFQAMFKNSLATPYTLGVASGAALGASLYFTLGLSLSFTFFNGVTIFSFISALLCVVIVYSMAIKRGRVSTHSLLLSGVVLSMICSSLILFLQFMGQERDAIQVVRWLMGGIDVVGFSSPVRLIPVVLISLFYCSFNARKLNIMYLGDDIALTRGVNIYKFRKSLYIVNSIVVAMVVAECGPIGFVGLLGPHMAKKVFGHKHQQLIPASFMVGGILLNLCDLLSRNIMEETLLPVGVMTALLGGPFLLYLLSRPTKS